MSPRSPAAYLQPARARGDAQQAAGVSPPGLRNGDMFASAPPVPAGMLAMRHPIRGRGAAGKAVPACALPARC